MRLAPDESNYLLVQHSRRVKVQTTYPKMLGTPNNSKHGLGRSPFPYDLQTAMFGEPSLVIPHKAMPADLLTLGVASHECDECLEETTPVLLSDQTTWNLYPCHMSECSCCDTAGIICDNCGKVEDSCCDCSFCSHCDEKFDSDDVCSYCGYCQSGCSCYSCDSCGQKLGFYCDYWTSREDGEPLCESCYESYRENRRTHLRTPGWVARGWTTERNVSLDAERAFRKKYGKALDPAQMMCDFYISDYVMAVLPIRANSYSAQGVWTVGPEYGPDGHLLSTWTYTGMVCEYRDPMVEVRRNAKVLQDSIIQRCDEAFRHYAYMAIGGEVRHHPNAADGSPAYGRANTWTWFAHMGDQYGRIPMIEDAIALFEDSDAWNGGYGGETWAECARILLARETGKLDPKTFVDRVFTLQHHGGSFLNKVSWANGNDGGYGVSSMQMIGNAHAAEVPDFVILLRGATEDARTLLESSASHAPNEDYRDAVRYGLRKVATLRPVDETATAVDDETDTDPTYLASFAGEYGDYCLAKSPNGAWNCTAHKGHGGKHVAYWTEGTMCDSTDGVWS